LNKEVILLKIIIMKNIILFSIIVLLSISLYGQEADTLYKEDMKELIKEMQMKEQNLNAFDVDKFYSYFNPKLIDTFFIYIQNDNYNKIYDNSDDILKDMQSKEDLVKYLNAIKHIYGKIKTYNNRTYSIKSQLTKPIAYATYDVEFENTKAVIQTGFTIIDSLTIKLLLFEIKTNDYTNFNDFDTLTKSTFDYIIAKNYKGLFNSTSKRFQDYTSLAKFEEFTDKLSKYDVKSYKLYQNQIGVVKEQIIYYLTYDINESEGYLRLNYTETNGKFLIEGINYEPNKK